MTNKKNKLRTSVLILIMALGSVIVNGYLDGYLDGKDKSSAIIKVLKNNCDCKTIKKSTYATTTQFEKGEFQLIGCNFESLEVESARINKILNKKVKKFDKVDRLKLEFISNEISQSVLIKNGIIQKSKL